MANVARTYTVAQIFQGPIDVYVNIAAPSSHTPPTQADEIAFDASGQPTSATGFHAGLVEGPTNIVVTEKCNEIMSDQHESPVDVAFDSTEAEIDITVKETTLTRLQTFLTSGLLGAYTALANSQALQVGGQLDSSMTPITLLLVSPDRAVSGKFLYVFAFKCYLKSAIATGFHRSKESIYKLKFGCFMDLTRVAGDELMNICKTK